MDKRSKISGAVLGRNLRERVDISRATLAGRDALQTHQRRWGMVVKVYDDPNPDNNGFYYLKKKNNTLGDNNNWENFSATGHGRLHSMLSNVDHAPASTTDHNANYFRYNGVNGQVEAALFEYSAPIKALMWQGQYVLRLEGAILTEGLPPFYLITEDEQHYIQQE